MKRLLLLYLMILVSLTGNAQTFTGRVIDKSGKPLVSASVVAKGDSGFVVAFARAGQDGHISTKHVIPDGGTLIFYTGTTASNGTLVIEGYSSVAETYADIDPHTVDNGWGDAVSVWGTNDSRTKIGYEAQNLKIVITRNGTTQIVKIYKK